MAPRSRPSLQAGLDREVYQIVRTYADQENESPPQLRSHTIYDWIQHSNSSLKRRPKKQLEDSIERAIDLIRSEESKDNEDDLNQVQGKSGAPPQETTTDSMSGDWMNKQIVASWPTNNRTRMDGENANENTIKRNGMRLDGDRERKRQKRAAVPGAKVDMAPPTNVSLQDLGGVSDVKRQLKDHLILPLLYPQRYLESGIPTPRGILLHGPPGCGKTLICRAFAAELRVPFIEILGPAVVSGMSGESEKQIRELFKKAKEAAPCLLFIDEIDVIAPKRDDAQSQMEKRMVAQLLISMDSLAIEGNDDKPVIVLAATNRPDSLDPALRRGGRFDTEICMGVPNKPMREMIIRALTRKIRLSADVDFSALAKKTAGFVGADLKDLVSKAGTCSMTQFREALENQAAAEETDTEMLVGDETSQDFLADREIARLVKRVRDTDAVRPPGFEHGTITMENFNAVLPTITPSSKREGFATVPDTTWDHVGALQDVRQQLKMTIVNAIQQPDLYEKYGISPSTGVLLWGPPGCGKTLLAKAVAAESKANFISVKGPELLDKYVGESERAIRRVFQRARSSVPCVIFFDEFDALVPKRSSKLHEASARVVNTLLTEFDGLTGREGIYIMAATNRPEMMDDAMLRPGRLEKLLYVGLPTPDERVDILRSLLGERGAIQQDLARVAQLDVCANFSGADLAALVKKARLHALERRANGVEEIDFLEAAETIRPSVEDLRKYEKLRERF
ncbi:Ribosome biogenesis ATPase rix7 [Pleosporales sp. CAS-2024a]